MGRAGKDFLHFPNQAVDNSVGQQEQEGATSNPVETLHPAKTAVGAAGNPVQDCNCISDKTGEMKKTPYFLTDMAANIEAEHQDNPDIEAQLTHPNPEWMVVQGGEGNKDLE